MKNFLNKIRTRMSKASGFTLIEVIIAVAIIAVVSTAFATALVGSARSGQKNNERMKEREAIVANIDDKIASTKAYTDEQANAEENKSTYGFETTQIKLYKSGESTPYETKDCYVIKSGVYEGYAKKAN